MSDDPELIKKLRESTQATERWPDSMKKLHEIRQKADAFFSERKGQDLSTKREVAKVD